MKEHIIVMPGEWIQPTRRTFDLRCCDCGLVHSTHIRLVTNDHGPGKKIQLCFFRDNRATGQVRRNMKKEK